MSSSWDLSVRFPVSLFYVPGLHLKFILPSNLTTHISDWDSINRDPFIHDPLLVNTNDPFLIFWYSYSIFNNITSNFLQQLIFRTTFNEIQTKTDLNFEKGRQL